VVFPGDALVVKGVENELSTPSVQRSEFSSDGSEIVVTFDSPTNRGGEVNVDHSSPCLLFLSLVSPTLLVVCGPATLLLRSCRL
jgi:hypothetical protein